MVYGVYDLRDFHKLLPHVKKCEMKNVKFFKQGVYTVEEKGTTSKRIFALKIIFSLKNCFDELIIMKKLKHRNIAQFIDGGIHCEHHHFGHDVVIPIFGSQRDIPKITPLFAWIKMPLYPRTLLEAIKNGESLDYDFRIKIVIQLTDAAGLVKKLEFYYSALRK
ncbi:hypothetical protein B4U80_14135 [Leptotrombidium deliense]|uniref:Protein kinase domain-containing protein n=1 Tax=Leptotrombidium deliense TaxID=299467 RepID=A0A443S1X4_9ACAR|nr:hypothetical protein B4U80_14135 [Leptotrombidium deliense]